MTKLHNFWVNLTDASALSFSLVLAVQILKLLGHLGTGDAESTELMTDILSKVAASRGVVRASNTASAIAYQCVVTIMQV